MQEIRLLSNHNQYWGDGGVCICMKMYMQAPFVCSFIFSFFSMLGMKDKPSTGLRRRIFMAEVEVIKAVEGIYSAREIMRVNHLLLQDRELRHMSV